MKTDTSIRNICIASIKRKTIRPIDFSLTKFFQTETFSEIYINNFKLSDTSENELPISQTIIDKTNWTLVTTRQIISCVDGITKIAKADNIVTCTGMTSKDTVRLLLQAADLNLIINKRLKFL
ncbi:MAG TPA: hypothetical protein VGI43_02145 [Mucilaginibacter sp.]|jgi:hypothetical protein